MKKELALFLAALFAFGRLASAALAPSGDTTGATDYAAITAAIAQGGTVELGEGTFCINAQIELTSAVTLKGAGRDVTIIKQMLAHKNSNPCARVFRLNHEDAVVQGVTITGGYTYNLGTQDAYGKHSGAGVLIDTNGGQVLDCRITDNEPSMNDYGAVHLVSSKGIIARTIIDNNTNGNGYPYSGVGLTMTAGRVESCLIANNYANGANRDKTPEAGGVCISGGTLQNCTIVGNTGWNVGGLHVSGSSAKVINCIVFGNKLSGSKTDLAGAPDYYCSSGTMDLSTCLLSIDPTFKNAATDDYHVSCGGAAADKGTGEETFVSNTDLEGNARVVNGKCDLGCYENIGFDDWIDISGAPEEYGTVSPAYGQTGGLAADGVLPVSAPASLDIDGNTVTCAGWKLYDAAGGLVSEGPETSFEYSHEGIYRKLVWQWVASFKVTATAGDGGTVKASSETAGYGDVVTITATPDPELAGVSFWKWVGDVPAENIYDNPLELTVDAAKSVQAVFGTAHAYVASAESPSAAPTFPYGSAETAANSIEEAFAVTADNGVIECGEGTFSLSADFAVNRPVTIRGAGYDKTTLNLNSKHLTVSSSNARIEGFKVTGARIEWNVTGGGIIVSAGTVANCRFTGNVDNNGINAKGLCAGVSGSGRITHCIFDGNDTTAKNTIGVLGITGGLVDNCLIVSNKCQQGGGVYVGGGGTMRNCTIADNTATTGKGGGIFVADNCLSCVLVNCIVYGNTAKTGGDEYQFGGNSGFNSSKTTNNCFGKDNGTGLNPIDDNPSLGADYRLNPGSAGINQGAAYDGMTDDTDLGGDPRVVGDAIDLGCYEYVPSTVFSCTIGANAWSGLVGGSVQLSANFDEEIFDPADYIFAWTVTGADTSAPVVDSVQKPLVTLPSATEYTVSLVVTDKDGRTVFSGTADQVIKTLPATVYLASENPGCEFPYDTEAKAATNLVNLASILVGGVTVVALPGEHRTDKMIEITKEITIRGKEGKGRTTIRRTKIDYTSPSSRVFVLNNANAVLEGLTISGGHAYSANGAGVSIEHGTVADCRITGNTTSMNAGGAVRLSNSDARLLRSIVDNNVSDNANGNSPGISLGAGIVESCLIYSNVVKNCSARKFSVPGGVQMGGGTLRNCTVTANHGRGVGGISFWDGWNWQGGKAENCIVYGNTAQADYWVSTSPEYYANDANKTVNCLFADPLFVDAANMDFHLQAGSPAINAGTYGTWMDSATDLDGNPRVKHVKEKQDERFPFVDVGCYESRFSPGRLLLEVR